MNVSLLVPVSLFYGHTCNIVSNQLCTVISSDVNGMRLPLNKILLLAFCDVL